MANSLAWHDGHYGKGFKFITEFNIYMYVLYLSRWPLVYFGKTLHIKVAEHSFQVPMPNSP